MDVGITDPRMVVAEINILAGASVSTKTTPLDQIAAIVAEVKRSAGRPLGWMRSSGVFCCHESTRLRSLTPGPKMLKADGAAVSFD